MQDERTKRVSNAPPRLLFRVEQTLARGYTFEGAARHLGLSQERLRELIRERFQEQQS